MKYLKHPSRTQLLTWIDEVYAAESIRTGLILPQPGCSYGEPCQTLDGDWAIEIVPYAEPYTQQEPWVSMVVIDPQFPAPPDPTII